ncbi:hypothetical protein [Grimontia celer]|uniref:hypothetical protein n=1 Tax=Grimontia celer TaxID=1796497 RepID=UPI0007894A81|nr:hypothetical protein [Grimontia celer]
MPANENFIISLKLGQQIRLAIVIDDGDEFEGPFYIKTPFTFEPDFGVASINYDLNDLLTKAVAPEKTV